MRAAEFLKFSGLTELGIVGPSLGVTEAVLAACEEQRQCQIGQPRSGVEVISHSVAPAVIPMAGPGELSPRPRSALLAKQQYVRGVGIYDAVMTASAPLAGANPYDTGSTR